MDDASNVRTQDKARVSEPKAGKLMPVNKTADIVPDHG